MKVTNLYTYFLNLCFLVNYTYILLKKVTIDITYYMIYK